jgi:hypothetical protein
MKTCRQKQSDADMGQVDIRRRPPCKIAHKGFEFEIFRVLKFLTLHTTLPTGPRASRIRITTTHSIDLPCSAVSKDTQSNSLRKPAVLVTSLPFCQDDEAETYISGDHYSAAAATHHSIIPQYLSNQASITESKHLSIQNIRR